jgi:hypothetical protein
VLLRYVAAVLGIPSGSGTVPQSDSALALLPPDLPGTACSSRNLRGLACGGQTSLCSKTVGRRPSGLQIRQQQQQRWWCRWQLCRTAQRRCRAPLALSRGSLQLMLTFWQPRSATKRRQRMGRRQISLWRSSSSSSSGQQQRMQQRAAAADAAEAAPAQVTVQGGVAMGVLALAVAGMAWTLFGHLRQPWRYDTVGQQ